MPYQSTPPVQPDVPLHAPSNRQRLRRKTRVNASSNTSPVAAQAETTLHMQNCRPVPVTSHALVWVRYGFR